MKYKNLEKVYPINSFCRQDLLEMGYTEKEASNVNENYMEYIAEYISDKVDGALSGNNVFWTALEEAIEELKKTS